MKTVNAAVSNSIRKDYAVSVIPRLIAEWNMNLYFNPTADNVPDEDSEGYDIEVFPIEAIVRGNRPTKGICKARINEATVSKGYTKDTARYYVGSADDVYKYWTSPVQTDGSGVFPTTANGRTKVRPFIVYNANVSVNKIVIKVEDYWASPDQFYIRTTTSADPSEDDWSTIATSPAIASDGTVTLYWNGSTWTSVRPASMINPPLRTIRGIMVQVDTMKGGRDRLGRPSTYRKRLDTMNEDDKQPLVRIPTTGAKSFFNLIEISARREVDLSDRLMNVEDSFEMSSVSELYPIGTITSNTGTLTLSNIYTEGGADKTGYFNPGNPTSIYSGMLEPNVKFNLEYIYTINGTTYPVQQFIMYGEDWQGLVSDEVTIELSDFSKFFNEVYPQPALWSDLTVPEIFQRVLDSVGFVDWELEDYNETRHIIPNFWVDGEKNVWEVLDDLAKGTQSAIYFDGFGKLRVKTRKNAFDIAKVPTWTLRGVNSGTELQDIVSLEQGDELGANHLTITYKSTDWSREVRGMPAMDKVWEPDNDTVVLRASTLVKDIDDDTTIVQIPETDAKVWPYEGMFEIQGEIFRYSGKRFCYYTYNENVDNNGNVTYTNEVENHVTVTSQDELEDFHKKTPSIYRHKNHWTGGLKLDDEQESRGVWNSEQRNHNVDLNGWSCSRETLSNGTGVVNTNSPGMSHNKSESSMRLRGLGDANDLLIATHGNPGQDEYKFFGTQIRLIDESGLTNQQAGIVVNCNNSFAGYYIEIKASEKIPNKNRKARGEIALFNRTGATYEQLDSANFPVVEKLIYDLDVQIREEGANKDHRIVVWINGKEVINFLVKDKKKAMGGQFATYVRGKTLADFQYFYAIRREVNDPPSDASFFNLKEGGYTGRFWDREWVWGWKTVTRRKKKKQTKEKVKWGLQFFDEFGPIVHEVRMYDVKFDPKPVLHSRLYMSNEWTAVCPEYRADPFGAHFILVNAARENAVIKGSDSLVFGGAVDVPINQVLTVLGRVLIEQDEETIEVSDEESIKIRGKVEAELESTWIQSKKMAKDVSEWMKNHWSKGLDQLSVEVFGNPLIEVGDVVAIDYPEKFMTSTKHKYFVVAVSNSFENGLTTSLQLRRVA